MSKHAPAEDVHISRAHVQIPEEVSQGLALKQAAHAIVSPDSLLPVDVAAPGLALFVEEDDVQAQAVDHTALHERDDVHIPADPGAFAELGVDLWEETGGEEGRDDVRDEGVERKGEQDLMRMQRERWQTKEAGDAHRDGLERGGRLDGVRVEHGCTDGRPGMGAKVGIGLGVLSKGSRQHGGHRWVITSGGLREQTEDETAQSRTRFGCVLLNTCLN